MAAASTTVTPSGATTTYNSTAGEGVSLAANVSSAAGTVNQGSVTFTITNSASKQVAQATISVADGVASGNYYLPAGTAPGAYTIQAVYNGTPSYAASLPGSGTLTVGAATTTTAASSSTVGFNSTGESPNLTATVTSPGGAVNTGTITFTIMSGATTIGAATSANVVNGTASTAYPIDPGAAIGTYTIQAAYTATTDFGGSSDSTHSLSVTQPPPAKLIINAEPPATAAAGTPFATAGQPIVVYEEDQFGNLESGDNSTVVSVKLGSGSGPLVGPLTETVVGGVATFSNLADDAAETITLTFSSGNLAPATSSSIVVGPGAGARLIVTQQPSPAATAGKVFATQPIVEEVDQYGNIIDDSTDAVSAAVGDTGTSTLLGTTLNVKLVDGVATFSGLSYNKAEPMDIAFTSNVDAIAPATSNLVIVSPAAASQLVIGQQPSSTATVGQPFATQPVVYEEDPFYNIESGDSTSQVTAMLASGAGPLRGLPSVTLVNGVARFGGLSDNTAETITLDFSSGPLLSAPSSPIVVGPAAASRLLIESGYSTTAVAGQPLATPPTVEIVDSAGNVETGDNATQITVSLAGGPGKLLGTTTVTVQGGVATFPGLADDTAGSLTLAFSATDSLTAGAPSPIVVGPAAASQLVIQTQPSPTATAAAAFTVQPLVYEEDQYGNVETGDSSSTVTASLATGSGPLQGNTVVTLAGGVAAFHGLSDPKAETITLKFTDGSLVTPASNPIAVGAGPAAGLEIVIGPYSSVTAGSPLTDPIVIDEVDAEGNVVAGDNSTQVTASLATGSGTLIGTTAVTVQDGVASFNDLEDDKAGTLAPPVHRRDAAGGRRVAERGQPGAGVAVGGDEPAQRGRVGQHLRAAG